MKLSSFFVFASVANCEEACTEFPINADRTGGTGVIQNQAWLDNRSYSSQDSCVWELRSSEKLMIRFNNFDTDDSKLCDNNPANDHRGDRSVFEFSFNDGSDWYTEKLCHSIGEDRFNHKNGLRGRSGQIRSFAGGNPKKWKHNKFGDNLMGWTQINAEYVKFTFAVGPKANNRGNGPFKGFRLEYATISDLKLETLKDEILNFVNDDQNYSPTIKSGVKRSFKKYITMKMDKAHKQNSQKCRTMAENVPNFVKEEWENVDSMRTLVKFLAKEDWKDKGASGFKGYFDFVHAGCWKKIDALENMDKWHQRFEGLF